MAHPAFRDETLNALVRGGHRAGGRNLVAGARRRERTTSACWWATPTRSCFAAAKEDVIAFEPMTAFGRRAAQRPRAADRRARRSFSASSGIDVYG
jgi:hypothetical protein